MRLDEALEVFAGNRRILVASDFDGTLSHLVSDPDQARAVPGAEQVLAELCLLPLVTVALVSGRGLEDLRARFESVPDGLVTVGEHGAAWDEDLEPHPGIHSISSGLESIVAGVTGAFVETKRSSVSLHFRNVEPSETPKLEAAAVEFLEEVLAGPNARIERGRGVVEATLMATTKSHAVEQLRRQSGAGAAIFFGDDISDEAVFEGFGPGDIGVKVGNAASAATHRVAEPTHVVAALERLVSLR